MERNSEERCSVLVVVTDPTWRATLERACRAAGAQVRAMGAVAEVERWPEGEIVITDAAHVTPFWKSVGAVEVIALVSNAAEGYAALDGGASKWLAIDSSVAEVIAAVRSHVLSARAQPSLPSESQRTNVDGLNSDMAWGDGLGEFLSEYIPPDAAKAFRERSRESPGVSPQSGRRVPEMSTPLFEQMDSTITLRPVKDRRSSVRKHRFRLSTREYVFVALAAILGGGACFALFRDSVPAIGGAPNRPPLSEQPASGVATANTRSDSPLPSTSGRVATEARVEAHPPQDLTGWWAMTNQVQVSGYRPYQGLRLGYRLQLRQEGSRIIGDGHKWLENGRAIPRASRTPITVSGVMDGRRMALTFSERGRRRQSHGTFDLELVGDGKLRGKFESDAARSRGSSVAQRVANSEIEPR